MSRVIAGIVLFVLCPMLSAKDQIWSLDSLDKSTFTALGKVDEAAGVRGRSMVFGGNTLLRLKNSAKLTTNRSGFSLTAWVNPYRLNGTQQVIAGKNRYSLDERQWGVMIDKDNRFRLYVWQGKWAKAGAPTTIRPGHWYLVGISVRPTRAELWINGKRQGQVKLKRPVPQTAAPFTLAGIDDNGRIRQNLVGAMDEVRWYDRPLSDKEMAASYKPVTATHKIPAHVKPFKLWNGKQFPKSAEIEVLEGVKFHVIKRWEPQVDGYRWLHGIGLAWHRGKLYASFGHNKGRENTVTEIGRYCVSSDGGKTWSAVKTMDVGSESADLAVSHGVFLSHQGTLWAFMGAFYNTRQKVHTRAYTLDESNGQWRPQGVVVTDGFWPMTEPVKMNNGNWLMAGLTVGQGNPAAVAISVGNDLTKWQHVSIPRAPNLGTMWGESAAIISGNQVLNIARYGQRANALVATSNDFGKTWVPTRESNMPMAGSKPYAGVLSSGQRYLICSTTADGGHRRNPLTIAVSRPGETTFTKVFVIRPANFPQGPGESTTNARLSYPYALEHAGRLYVGYSNDAGRGGNLNSAELAIIPVSSLKTK